MSEATSRNKIRESIQTFRHERLFQTGWAGELSFAEIHTDLVPNLNRLLRYYRKPAAYIPDIIQEGFMCLWWDCHFTPHNGPQSSSQRGPVASRPKETTHRPILYRMRYPLHFSRSIGRLRRLITRDSQEKR